MRFRKKPVVIDATRWFRNGDHPLDYSEPVEGFENGKLVEFSPAHQKRLSWEGQVVRYYRRPDMDGQQPCKHCGKIMHDHGWIETLEGGHTVCPGDWIITGVQGERYPCKPEIFYKTYERADSPNGAAGGVIISAVDLAIRNLRREIAEFSDPEARAYVEEWPHSLAEWIAKYVNGER